MYCHNCGVPLDDRANFCPSCGARQKRPEASPAPFSPSPFGGDSNPSGNRPRDAWPSRPPAYVEDRGIREMFFRYDNRLNRKRFILRHFMLGFAAGLASFIAVFAAGIVWGRNAVKIVWGVFYLLMLIPAFLLDIRRLHDLDRPAWWSVFFFVPFINLALALYLLFAEGTHGANRYGPDPLEGKH